MDIKVVVSEKRKCAASIDWRAGDYIDESHIQRLAVLSFGDKSKPDTDVEVLFSLDQLKELNNVISKALDVMSKTLKEPYGHIGRC